MMQNSPTAIVMRYMNNGADIKTALSQAAKQYPEIFPQQQVTLAMAVLSKPEDAMRQYINNMARERAIDLNTYVAQLREEIKQAIVQ